MLKTRGFIINFLPKGTASQGEGEANVIVKGPTLSPANFSDGGTCEAVWLFIINAGYSHTRHGSRPVETNVKAAKYR